MSRPKQHGRGKSAECQKGFPAPRKRWEHRCQSCNGRGKIMYLTSEDTCPRCNGEGVVE